MISIPQLDISEFELNRDAFIEKFGAAYSEWGFAGLTGHGLDRNLVEQAMSESRQFFSLTEDQKKVYLHPDGYNRGYIPFGVEKAKDSEHFDLKEFFHIGRELESASHLGENIWPHELPNFKPTFETLFSELDKLAHRVLEMFALYLGVEQNYFDNKIEDGEALLRVLHYPPILDESAPNVRAAAHEDINLLTLLVGSHQAGLEVLSKQNEWVPISMIEGTIICNVGDMMQRLSNGKIRSTTHRVVNPRGDEVKKSRYSMPFFMHPGPKVRLDVLPQCVDEKHPAQFEPISADEFLQERLRAIGLVKNQS